MTWTIPTMVGQGLSIAPNAQLRGTRYRRADVDFVLRSGHLIDPPGDVADQLNELCSPEARARRREAVFHGDIGFGEWIGQVVAASGIPDTVTRPKSFGHRVEFALTSTGGIGPQFRVVNLTGSATLSAEIQEIYSLAVAFSYIDPREFLFPPVWVVNQPHQPPVLPPRRSDPPMASAPRPRFGLASPLAAARRRPVTMRSFPLQQPDVPPAVQDRLDYQLRSLQSTPFRFHLDR